MKMRTPVIHTIAVCEKIKTKQRVICDIYDSAGKITVEYDGLSYDTNLYSSDIKKAISSIFKLDYIKQYHFHEFGKIFEEVKLHNEKLKQQK